MSNSLDLIERLEAAVRRLRAAEARAQLSSARSRLDAARDVASRVAALGGLEAVLAAATGARVAEEERQVAAAEARLAEWRKAQRLADDVLLAAAFNRVEALPRAGRAVARKRVDPAVTEGIAQLGWGEDGFYLTPAAAPRGVAEWTPCQDFPRKSVRDLPRRRGARVPRRARRVG